MALALQPTCLFDAELGIDLALTVEPWQVVGVLLALGLGMFPELLLQWVLFIPEENTVSKTAACPWIPKTGCYTLLSPEISIQDAS